LERAALRLLGRRVRQLRKQLGWSQEELAEAADLHENYVSRLETGRQEPGFFVLLRLCRALGIAPAAFFGDFNLRALKRLRLK
jgi:XRE family transcriptional regulator, regulator of sulfur utilization